MGAEGEGKEEEGEKACLSLAVGVRWPEVTRQQQWEQLGKLLAVARACRHSQVVPGASAVLPVPAASVAPPVPTAAEELGRSFEATDDRKARGIFLSSSLAATPAVAGRTEARQSIASSALARQAV